MRSVSGNSFTTAYMYMRRMSLTRAKNMAGAFDFLCVRRETDIQR